MMKTIVITLLISSSAFGAPASGECTGTHRKVPILFKAHMADKSDYASFTGALYHDDRMVAEISGKDDIKINLLTLSFKARNGQGDYIEGRVTNLFNKVGKVKILSIPAYGINIENFEVSCWTR